MADITTCPTRLKRRIGTRATCAWTKSSPAPIPRFTGSASRNQPSIIPGPFGGLADGGGFFTGNEQINGYNAAISETHIFSPTKADELRLGYIAFTVAVAVQRQRDVSGQIGFPGVPYSDGSNNGGLPQLTFSDAATLGSRPTCRRDKIQNTYSVTDTFTLIHGAHTWKWGGDYRPEEFTIYQPAAPRGELDFGTVFTDNAGRPRLGR